MLTDDHKRSSTILLGSMMFKATHCIALILGSGRLEKVTFIPPQLK